MPEIIQDWLGTRLGILLDLSPQKFGRNTKDGVLLAQLLYSYGVIPVHVFEKIKASKNYFGCHKNLTVLKPWLEHIGVTQDDSALQEIARGEGSSAISLFYAVYLNLERKDRLYYVSAQKERRFSENSCKRKFKVNWVPEASLKDAVNSDVVLPEVVNTFLEKRDVIEWHRLKCQEVVEKIKKIKMKFSRMERRKEPKLRPVISKYTTSQPLDKRLLEAKEVAETIATFEKKHLQKSPDLTYSELIKLKNMFELQPCLSLPSVEEARNIVSNIKHRKKSEVYARNFQENMQNTVLDEEWKEIIQRQNANLEDTVCKTLLKRSQYEKQMARKLCQLRNQKKVFAENRNFVECLKMEQKSREFDEFLTSKIEFRGECFEDEEFERERLMQLHKRVYEEKVKARREFIRKESWSIIQSIIDIAVRISEIRELTSCQVPKALMKDLKELFYKNLPIFDILNNFEELFVNDAKPSEAVLGEENERGEDMDYTDISYNLMKDEERERQNMLNETDFVDYMHLLGPWMVQLLFPDGTETETQQLVLGYVVHKLLEIKYPIPNNPLRVPLKPMKPTAVIKYLEGEAYNMLVDLMECCRILVVRVDDAVNFVLSAYKEELSVVRDIDIAFQKLTEKALQDKSNAEKEKEAKKKIQLLKKEESANLTTPVALELNFLDKETQTPRMIPEDDPLLSPNAEIGKMAFEALGAGDPVPDSAIISAIVAYVSFKQNDYDGWILVNYPQLYVQASDLECALTGYRLMPINDDMASLEEVEGFTYREPCVDPFSRDDFAQNRISRLVSKPNYESPIPVDPSTYFNIFVKLKKISDPSRPQSDEETASSLSPVEEFYSEQKVFCTCEYLTLNFQTIKNLGKTILNENLRMSESNLDLEPKTSLEIFGSGLTELNEKWDPTKKKVGKSNDKAKGESVQFPVTKTEPKNEEEPKKMENGKSVVEARSPSTRPGGPDWEWASGDQPEMLLLALASIWENMEAVFVEDLKDVFFCLRTHRSNVLSYCGFIKKSIRNVMRQPDEKQKVLGDFQQMFNEIDEDLRPDVDIKCELHVRVSELEEALLGIADERRANSLKDVTKVTQDSWVADEMANLVNHFLSIVQLEADRSVSTCQVLMDYYASVQQKMPEEKPIGKIFVAKLHVKDRKYSILSSSPPHGTSSSQLYTPKNSEMRRDLRRSLTDVGTRNNAERPSKTRSWTDKRRKSSDVSFLTGAAEVIREILINLSLPEDGMTPFHNFFRESVQLATKEISGIIETCTSDAKKGEKTVAKNPKKGSDPAAQQANGNAVAEWETALDNELSRFLFRMKLILARGIYDMNEFLATILNTLSALTEDINEMYLREVESISQCCKVFRCSIEEEIPIRYLLELKEDEFYVNEDVLLFSTPEKASEEIVGRKDKIRFSVDQLCLLFEKLHRVAPDGEIIKRSLLFILEDLRALNPEIKNCDVFPDVWKCLDPEDMVSVVNEIYQDLEIVTWKDFVVYALEITPPTEEEILSMRKQFREWDPQVSELIIREDYDKVRFWFEANADEGSDAALRNEKTKDLLFKMYQVDDYQTNYSALLLAFCKDENPIYGFTKALSLVMGKKITTNEYSDEEYLPAEGEYGRLEDDEVFRLYGANTLKNPYCCPSSSTEIYKKCIPKEKITRCPCSDPRESVLAEEEETSFTETWGSEVGEAASLFYYEDRQTSHDSVISAVPYHILSSLLKASFPALSQLSALLDCKETFQETLNSLYDGSESRDDRVRVYKLLRHKFVSRLIQSTNKFRFVKIRQILKNLLKSEKFSSRSFCYLENLNCNLCVD